MKRFFILICCFFLLSLMACGLREPKTSSTDDPATRPTGNEYPQSLLKYEEEIYEYVRVARTLPEKAVRIGAITGLANSGMRPKKELEASNSEIGLPVYALFTEVVEGDRVILYVERNERAWQVYTLLKQ